MEKLIFPLILICFCVAVLCPPAEAGLCTVKVSGGECNYKYWCEVNECQGPCKGYYLLIGGKLVFGCQCNP